MGWSGGAMVLIKLSVPGRPTNSDNSRTRAYCACSRCGWGWFGLLFSRLSFLFSFSPLSLWETARYTLKYCLKGPLSPKQPTFKVYLYIIKVSAFLQRDPNFFLRVTLPLIMLVQTYITVIKFDVCQFRLI